MKRLHLSRVMVWLGYFGLFFSLLAWYGWLASPGPLPRWLALLLALAPLLFPLRGLLYQRIYTHQWASLIGLWYFILGFFYLPDAHTWPYGLALISLSLIFFAGCLLYVKAVLKAQKAAAS